jgi:lysine 2,3-aminomutase
MTESPRYPSTTLSFRERFFATATDAQWGDWRWQMRHSIKSGAQLAQFVSLTPDERAGIADTAQIFRLGVAPYYLGLIDPIHPLCPVRMQVIPVGAEAIFQPTELNDPLGEDHHRPVETIVHKYPDRVLFLVTDTCAVYCRHCTRRRITKGGEAELTKTQIELGLEYIQAHSEVRDVLISGGDPLLLSDERLENILMGLRKIPHVEMIRIGTRLPVCLPMRVTENLVRILRRAAPLFVVTHFNHPKEVTPEARAACELLVDAGVPVENQTVLMRRLNSSSRIIKELNHACLKMRVRPYYLHQMDVAQGCEHLRTPLAVGLQIIEELRGFTTGMAVPHLAVDLPGGGGKVTIQPNYVVAQHQDSTEFLNYRKKTYRYPEPALVDSLCPYDEVWRGRAL